MDEPFDTALQAKLDSLKIGLRNYAEKRIHPGTFLVSVLSNDLMGAFGMADRGSRRLLHELCHFIHWELPRGCHGNLNMVQDWLAKTASTS